MRLPKKKDTPFFRERKIKNAKGDHLFSLVFGVEKSIFFICCEIKLFQILNCYPLKQHRRLQLHSQKLFMDVDFIIIRSYCSKLYSSINIRIFIRYYMKLCYGIKCIITFFYNSTFWIRGIDLEFASASLNPNYILNQIIIEINIFMLLNVYCACINWKRESNPALVTLLNWLYDAILVELVFSLPFMGMDKLVFHIMYSPRFDEREKTSIKNSLAIVFQNVEVICKVYNSTPNKFLIFSLTNDHSDISKVSKKREKVFAYIVFLDKLLLCGDIETNPGPGMRVTTYNINGGFGNHNKQKDC